jgi:hypothetical protein
MGTENRSVARQPSRLPSAAVDPPTWVTIDASDFGDDPNSAANAQRGAVRSKQGSKSAVSEG